MLPEGSALKKMYQQMLDTADALERSKIEAWLRAQMIPGSIDVNIMTKVDRNVVDKDGNILEDALPAVNICPGPNIANFAKVVSLQTMTDHIYGRTNILSNPNRPHMFIAELHLYIDYLKEQLEADNLCGILTGRKKYYVSFFKNLNEGIIYYQNLKGIESNDFYNALEDAVTELDGLKYQYAMHDTVALTPA